MFIVDNLVKIEKAKKKKIKSQIIPHLERAPQIVCVSHKTFSIHYIRIYIAFTKKWVHTAYAIV